MSDVAPGSGPGSTPGALMPLDLRDVRYAVGGARRLDRVTLRLEANAGCTAIMGPNGAGKSLLLRTLNGLLAPDSGTVLWNGRTPGDAVRRRQSFVFQRPVPLHRSVRANLDFVLRLSPRFAGAPRLGPGAREARRARAARRDELLALVDLADRHAAPARRLSGGEQQRLALACALATDPDVLLLDEPTASLDPASTAAIERVVADARDRGTSVVLVTHDAGQARRLADSVVFVADGRVTEHTPIARFLDDPISTEARDYLAGRLLVPTSAPLRTVAASRRAIRR